MPGGAGVATAVCRPVEVRSLEQRAEAEREADTTRETCFPLQSSKHPLASVPKGPDILLFAFLEEHDTQVMSPGHDRPKFIS